MLSRPHLLLAAIALLGTTAGCTGLTKPDTVSISAEPAAAAPAAPAGQVRAPSAQQPTPAAMPEPAQAPGCGE